jgi:hypothetical protein
LTGAEIGDIPLAKHHDRLHRESVYISLSESDQSFPLHDATTEDTWMGAIGVKARGEEAQGLEYWRREAATWEERATMLEEEIAALKQPLRLVFRSLVDGEIVSRDVVKAGEEFWPGMQEKYPYLKDWSYEVDSGMVYAVNPILEAD